MTARKSLFTTLPRLAFFDGPVPPQFKSFPGERWYAIHGFPAYAFSNRSRLGRCKASQGAGIGILQPITRAQRGNPFFELKHQNTRRRISQMSLYRAVEAINGPLPSRYGTLDPDHKDWLVSEWRKFEAKPDLFGFYEQCLGRDDCPLDNPTLWAELAHWGELGRLLLVREPVEPNPVA